MIRFRLLRFFLWFACVVSFAGFSRSISANPALEGYRNFQAMSERIHQLGESDLVRVRSLAKTGGGRDVLLLTIGAGDPDEKPAILIVGNVHGPHLAAAELALQVAERLASGEDQQSTRGLLERMTLYVIPCPSPDAAEKCFQKPFYERAGNSRQTDDDRDFELGEDPPNDLNGDGWITMIRVEDRAGQYMPHPDDPRIMIQADAKKNEQGKYRLLTEGIDDDEDGQLNEDAGEGVSFNRNFTFQYPYFNQAAGPHQVSEAETRAVADFAFDHPNIALVLTLTPEDNLMHPWKAKEEESRIKKIMLPADGPYQDLLAEKYRTLHGGKDAPASPEGEGSFSEWVYFHFGRWSLAARAWWIPQVKAREEKADAKQQCENDDDKKPEDDPKKSSDEKRGAEEIQALHWFAQEKIDGFVDWGAVEHPDFPDRKVEVGGFKPFYRLNPPAALLADVAKRHVEYLMEVSTLLPRLSIESTEVESLGAGVFRLTTTVMNDGYLPTMCDMGRVNGQVYPTQIELELPETTTWIKGTRRSTVPRLEGNGGKSSSTWLVRIVDPIPATVKLRVFAPASVDAEAEVALPEEE